MRTALSLDHQNQLSRATVRFVRRMREGKEYGGAASVVSHLESTVVFQQRDAAGGHPGRRLHLQVLWSAGIRSKSEPGEARTPQRVFERHCFERSGSSAKRRDEESHKTNIFDPVLARCHSGGRH